MSKGRKPILFIIVASLLLGSLIYLGLCNTFFISRTPGDYLPDEVFGFKLEREITGTEAFEIVKKSHMGGLKVPSDMTIGYYQEGLIIWISKYSSERAAMQETIRMVKAIKRFGRGFEAPTKININGYSIYRTCYKSSFQYFWNKDDFLIYIVPGLLSSSDMKELILKINSQL